MGQQPCDLQLTTRYINGHQVIVVAGEIDICTTPIAHACLRKAGGISAEGGRDLVVDLSAVTFMDASGLSVLLRADHQARRTGQRLRVAAPMAPITRLLEVTHLDSYFDIYPTSQAAAAKSRPASPSVVPLPPVADGSIAAAKDVAPSRCGAHPVTGALIAEDHCAGGGIGQDA